MIEIDIPSIDPIQHEPKIILGLTSRQCLFIVPGVGLGIASFLLLKNISLDLAVITTALCVFPAVLFGWYRPFNMKFEQYLKLCYFNTFVASSKRVLKTDTAVYEKQLTAKERQALEKKQAKSTKNSSAEKDKNGDKKNKKDKKDKRKGL